MEYFTKHCKGYVVPMILYSELMYNCTVDAFCIRCLAHIITMHDMIIKCMYLHHLLICLNIFSLILQQSPYLPIFS